MQVQFSDKYETETKTLNVSELIDIVRGKYTYDFSIISFRLDLQNGVKEFYGDTVTIKILS